MWQTFDLVNRGVFMELGSPRQIGGVPGTKGMQNGVRSEVYEGKREAKKHEKEGEKGEERKEEGGGEKKRKKKEKGFSRSGWEFLSHFEVGFPKVLREWILGFGGRKEGRQRGSIRESFRYEHCVFLPFLLRLSLPLMFAA